MEARKKLQRPVEKLLHCLLDGSRNAGTNHVEFHHSYREAGLLVPTLGIGGARGFAGKRSWSHSAAGCHARGGPYAWLARLT